MCSRCMLDMVFCMNTLDPNARCNMMRLLVAYRDINGSHDGSM